MTEVTDELKPCPFCGGTDIRTDHNLRNHHELVFCDECDATVSREGTSANAIEAWNRRAAVPAQEAKPFAWYWFDQHGCLCIAADSRKPEFPEAVHPLYTHPTQEAVKVKATYDSGLKTVAASDLRAALETKP